MSQRPLSPQEQRVYDAWQRGLNDVQVCEAMGITRSNLHVVRTHIREKGWDLPQGVRGRKRHPEALKIAQAYRAAQKEPDGREWGERDASRIVALQFNIPASTVRHYARGRWGKVKATERQPYRPGIDPRPDFTKGRAR